MRDNPFLQIALLIGAIIYLIIICVLLKKKKLNIQYALIWIASGVLLIIFAAFPGFVSIIRDISHIETDANFVFVLLFAFVLLLLLSLSTIVTGFSLKIKKLCQTQALLEKRVRELESSLEEKRDK